MDSRFKKDLKKETAKRKRAIPQKQYPRKKGRVRQQAKKIEASYPIVELEIRKRPLNFERHGECEEGECYNWS